MTGLNSTQTYNNGHPNIKILITRMDNAFSREDYAEVIHSSASIFETMAKDIVNISSIQDQTLKSFFDRYRKDSGLPKEILNYILEVYESRNTTPLAGHGSTEIPQIKKEHALILCEMTKAFVNIEYKLRSTKLTLSEAPSNATTESSGLRFDFKRLQELTNYAGSLSGLNMSKENVAQWAEKYYDYFEKNDFEKFKTLFYYANSLSGLNMSKENAEQWVFENMDRISL
jgi:hypothetical protein